VLVYLEANLFFQKLAVAQTARSSNAPDLCSGGTGLKFGFVDWLHCLVFSSFPQFLQKNAKTLVNITSRFFLSTPFRIHNSLITLSVESVMCEVLAALPRKP